MRELLVTVLAIILSIERMNGQFGMARSLVACTLTGLIMGDIQTGILIGVQVQMIFIGFSGVGAAVPPDEVIGAIIATYLAIANGQGPEFALSFALPIALASQAIDIFARTLTTAIIHYVDKQVSNFNFKAMNFHLLGLLFIAVRVAIVVYPALTLGVTAVENFIKIIPQFILHGLDVAGGILPVVGFAMLLNMFNIKYLLPFLFIGFALATFGNFSIVGTTLIAVALAFILDHYSNKNRPTGVESSSELDELDELMKA